MKKLWTYAVCVIIGCGAVLALSMTLQAELQGAPVSFSADWAVFDDGDRMDGGKYYAGSEGIRLEGVAGGQPYIMIYNFERKLAWMLRGAERKYIETALDADRLEMDDLGQFGTPCPPDARAEHSGSEILHARQTEKWLCVIPGEETRTVWYDPRLQTPIRGEDEDELFELTNIEEGPQPTSLFVPPPGYVKK